MNPPASFESVFDTSFDAAVYGAGFVGFAAAQRLAASGWKVLLFDSTADLLWEASRALENRAGERSGAWGEWLGLLAAKGGADERYFECALAEVTAADLLRTSSSIRTLLYAVPVGVRVEKGNIAGVCVATKSGFQTIRASRWVDASEEGTLAGLCCEEITPREPALRFQCLIAQTLHPEALKNAVLQIAAEHHGLECLPSLRPEEWRLRWPAGDEALYREIGSLVKQLRDSATGFIVSHSSLRAYPIYDQGMGSSLPEGPQNLRIVSPSLSVEAIVSLSDRFNLGWFGMDAVLAYAGSVVSCEAVMPSAPVVHSSADVVVAGAGTSGAIAALAAARSGAKTIAIDFTSTPGGIGVGGLITSYFHGAPGGLQSEVDLRTQAMSFLLIEKPYGTARWHHDAKRMVLQEMFTEAGVCFIGDALLCRVEQDANGRVLSVLAATPGRLLRLSAAAFVDSTGDGDLCALAGAECIEGRKGDGRSLSYSQSALSFVRTDEGFALRGNNFDAGWVDSTDSEDLTRARLEGLAHYQPLNWREVGPFVTMAPLLGLRQSRQIVTDYSVTLADMVAHASFEDSLGSVATVADSHSVDYEFESDDLAFYFWTCRAFRHRIGCELPYRMLLPVGLANVWIACRAAGIDVDAANGLRMQREMQRLGEAAGIAAALVSRTGRDARTIDMGQLLEALDRSGAREIPADEAPPPSAESLYASLDKGLPGIHLWHLYQQWKLHCERVLSRITVADAHVSFYAAAVAAMAESPEGEPRLLQALCNREVGVTPEEVRVPGAYGQLIDIPFWLQAVVLLRKNGGERSLVPLRQLVAEPKLPFNVLTTTALTLEVLAARVGAHPVLMEALDHLLAVEPADALLPPSRSLWRMLSGEAPPKLANDRGTDTRQDHTWQLHLILQRTLRALGRPDHPKFDAHRADPRGFIRKMLK